MTDRITEIETEMDRHALRLQRLASDPDYITVEGFEYAHWLHAAKVRGALTEMLLRRIDVLNEERARLMGVAA